MPRPDRRSAAVTALLAAALAALTSPAAVAAEGFVVSGHTAGLYDGDKLDDLFQTLASIAYVLLIAGDDDDDDLLCGDHRHHHRHDDGLGCDDLGISVPQVQISASLGYAVTPRWTVGARYHYRYDRRHNDIARQWGGGPEVSVDLRGAGAVRPFVGGYWLFLRGQRRADGLEQARGTSLGLRTGVRVHVAPGTQFVLHAGLQDDRFPYAPFEGSGRGMAGIAAASRGAVVGLGMRFALR